MNLESGIRIQNVVVHYDNTEFALRRSGAKGRDSTFSYVHWIWIGALDMKFNPWDTAITFRLEWRPMSKTVFTQYEPFES